jgi:uncharacterized glyoxalase superfamily protein PhnB
MSAPAPQVWPTLRARDARALVDFYVAAFGFTETVVYAGDDGVIAHAELAWPPGGGIMLGQEREGSDGGAWPLRPGTFGGYAVTRDAAHTDEVYARAIAAGATPVSAPYDTDYGSHDCSVRDPEGNHWSFGTYPGHPLTR